MVLVIPNIIINLEKRKRLRLMPMSKESLNFFTSNMQILFKGDSYKQQVGLCHRLFQSYAASAVFAEFLRDETQTVESLKCVTGVPLSSVYRVLKKLRRMGLIEERGKLPRIGKNGGPCETLWGLKA